MSFELIWPIKFHVTFVTLEKFHIQMPSLMILQITICNKPFSTKIATKQLFLSVSSHMLQQAAVMAVLFVAALERALFYFGFVIFNHVFYLILILRLWNLNVTFRFKIRFLLQRKMRPFGNSKFLEVHALEFLWWYFFDSLFGDFAVEKWLLGNLKRPIYFFLKSLRFVLVHFEVIFLDIGHLKIFVYGNYFLLVRHLISLKLRITRHFLIIGGTGWFYNGIRWEVRCDVRRILVHSI